MDYSRLTIIVPTLDEEENIEEIIGRLSKLYGNVKIIVSDDGSKDRTKDAVLKMHKKNRNVGFLDRNSQGIHGLTASVVDAAMRVTTEYIIVMDADMQHPPGIVKNICEELDEGADLAVGVRTSVKEWKPARRIISYGMKFIAALVFRIRRKKIVSDMASGFFGIRTETFKKIIRGNRHGFVPTGYKVLLDILRMLDRNSVVVEVPYGTFKTRMHGESKFRVRRIIDTLDSIFKP